MAMWFELLTLNIEKVKDHRAETVLDTALLTSTYTLKGMTSWRYC